jgi:hypothetical protein
MWDPTISVAGDRISVASVSIYPHFDTGFPEICLVLSRQAFPEKSEIPKLVSLACCFRLKFATSTHHPINSTIDSLSSCFERSSRNRQTSDDLQDAQLDRQTRSTTFLSHLSLYSMPLLLFQERIFEVASTGLPHGRGELLPHDHQAGSLPGAWSTLL